jgi:hypothetical protein
MDFQKIPSRGVEKKLINRLTGFGFPPIDETSKRENKK